MKELIVLALVVGPLVFLLGAIVRFSILSPSKTRGARVRLRRPDPAGVAAVCGFPTPDGLADLYREASFIEGLEFQLVDGRQEPARRFDLGQFVPLTAKDVKEARAVHRVRDGIPIADDGDKGCYVVLANGTVVLRSPDGASGEVIVASSPAELMAFTAAEAGD